MMLFFSYIARKFATNTPTAVTPSLCRHDPTALPDAPILLKKPSKPHHLLVHWWDAGTVGVHGLLSPLLSPSLCLPNGFCPTSGATDLAEFSADLSWTTIAASNSDSGDASSQCSSLSDISADSWMMSENLEEIYKFRFAEDGDLVVFGDGRPLQRVSTITRTVGIAKRNRRHTLFKAWYDSAPLHRWLHDNKHHVPHILACIEEQEEEEDC